MQNKYEKYEQLSQNTLEKMTQSTENWLDFLDTASRMYKYSFDEQVLIYAQRPKTQACADYSFWAASNRMNRQVNPYCRGIALLDRDKRKLHYVYAVEDTEAKPSGNSKNPEKYIWKLNDDIKDNINEMLCKQGNIKSDSIDKTIAIMAASMARIKISDYSDTLDKIYDKFSPDIPKEKLKTAFASLVSESAAYIAAKRTGADVSSYFSNHFANLFLFKDKFLTELVGEASTDVAAAVLKQVERNVNEYKRLERSSEYAEYQREQYAKADSRERNTIYSGRGNSDISSVSGGGRGRTDSYWSIRENEGAVSEGELQSNIQLDVAVQHSDTALENDRRTGLGTIRPDSEGISGSGRNGRGAENDRPVEMGRSDEQLQRISEGDSNQGTDRNRDREHLIAEAEVQNTSAFSYDEAIHSAFEEVSLNNSFSDKQKKFLERIENYAVHNNVTEDIINTAFENAAAFKNTYGTREYVSRNIFARRLGSIEKEIETAINSNLSNIKSESVPDTEIPVVSENETPEQLSFFSENNESSSASEAAELSMQSESTVELAKPSGSVQDETEKNNFVITNENLGEGGAKAKYRANVAAVKTLKNIDAENRLATPEEQEILSKYVGWGGLKNAFEDFHDDWKQEYTELKELLTDDEYAAASASVLNAHYTSPTVISAMYEAMKNNGFTGGNILEPAMGVGNFFGTMPTDIRENSSLYGVELDSISGRIAKQLYQKANIKISGFEKVNINNDTFDLAIGNVPFGGYSLNEAEYNKYHFLIHDHFFAKSLDKVKPNGIVAFVTSKGTLDKQNDSVRKYLAERAELVGAIRLPNNAFKGNAGTEVTSDIIFLQKRENPIELTAENTPTWVNLGTTQDGLTVNQYFVDNPDMVLGKIVEGNKLYGHGADDTMCVAIEGAVLKEQLSEAIKNIRFNVSNTAEKTNDNLFKADEITVSLNLKNFSYAVIADNLYYHNNGNFEAFEGKKSDIPRIKGMIEIRDCLREVITCQIDNGSDIQLKALQNKLNHLYDSFVEKYGRLNTKQNLAAFKEDSSAPLLSSLEQYKGEEFIGKAAIFEKRTILAKTDVTSVDTAAEALTLSLSKKARVDMPYMQQLTGFTAEKLMEDLKGSIFENPMKMDSNGNPRLEAADEYLSGNIRKKLEYMQENYGNDSRYAHNIEALEKAMPIPLQAADIDIKLGAPCVPKEFVQQFMYDNFGTPYYMRQMSYHNKNSIQVDYSEITSRWSITNKSRDKDNAAANAKFGTKRKSAYEILEDCLNLQSTTVKDRIERDGKDVSVINQTETEFAQEKQRQLQESFKNWIYGTPERRDKVVEQYNRMFNSTRPREYDGSALEFPGMNNQKNKRL